MDEVKRTYIVILLDRSGSMKYTRKATLSGFNDVMNTIRKEAEGDGTETFVSFYTFNHDVVCHYKQMSVNFLQDLIDEEYVCEGDTAEYEAIGMAISDLLENTAAENPNNCYLVKIFSDGHNNRYHGMPGQPVERYKWSRAELAKLIEQVQTTDQWTFDYIGSNQDLSKVADELHFHKGSVANYSSDMGGTAVAFAANARQTGEFLKARRAAPAPHFNKMKNFHSDNECEIADYSQMSVKDVEQGKKAILDDKPEQNTAKALWRNKNPYKPKDADK